VVEWKEQGGLEPGGLDLHLISRCQLVRAEIKSFSFSLPHLQTGKTLPLCLQNCWENKMESDFKVLYNVKILCKCEITYSNNKLGLFILP
jgi:hypothetical protein